MVHESDFSWLQKFLFDNSANVLDSGKEYLAEVRLLPIARKEGLDSVHGLIERLRAQPLNGLHQKVIEAMTTNETSFFRDGHPFEALKKSILPKLIQSRARTRTLNFWCAASSSGQEPYSVLMLLFENFPELKEWNIQFFASDISKAMVQRSQGGTYSQLEISRGLPKPYLDKYFEPFEQNWRIKDDLRQRIKFIEINLSKPWPNFPVLDIVFIRNVMIYFDMETKRQILKKIETLIKPDGYLFMGGAETTINLNDSFQRMQLERSGCYQLREDDSNKKF